MSGEPAAAPRPPVDWRGYLKLLGPGVAIAATGVGAGDMIAASVAGAKYGHAVVWAAIVGALLKYFLNEGLARWQLASGTTLLQGWVEHLGRWVAWFFLCYLVFWSFMVAGALANACGLAAHALVPQVSQPVWAVVHALLGAGFVIVGGYERFELVVKVIVALMFVTLIGCALLVQPPWSAAWQSIVKAGIPAGGVAQIMSVMGGVGGSVTLLAYGYWIREKRWAGKEWIAPVRFDLAVAYLLTGLFGAALMILAAQVLFPRGMTISGGQGVVTMGRMVGEVAGPIVYWTFLVGFWGAVATSLLGVWQGDPYLFCDFLGILKRLPAEQREALTSTRSTAYRGYLLYIAIAPLSLLAIDRPVMVIVAYAIVGALFMPFLAGTLLYLNNRRDLVGELRNSWRTNLLLVSALLLFAYLVVTAVQEGLEDLRPEPAVTSPADASGTGPAAPASRP